HFRSLVDSIRWIFAPPAGMETPQVIARLIPQFIVDVIVKAGLAGAILAGHFNPRALAEWHREVAVQPMSFTWRHDHWQRYVIGGDTVTDTKKVTHRDQYTWLFFAIPIHFQD